MSLLTSLSRLWSDFRWPFLGAAGLLTLFLGHVGFTKHYILAGHYRYFTDALYLSFQLFTLSSGNINPPVPWELEVARFMAPAVAAFATIQALATVFRDHFQLLRLHSWKDHIVLCGLGKKGFALVNAFLKAGDRVVIIERDVLNPFVRRCRGPQVIVLSGDATDPEMLRKAGIKRASRLVSICRDDGANAEGGLNARKLTIGRSGDPLSVTVHIVDVELCHVLRNAMEAGIPGAAMVDFFNVYETSALTILNEWPPFGLVGDSMKAGLPQRIIVVGMGRLGQSVVFHAARKWHFTRGSDSGLLRVAIVDRDAVMKSRSFSLQNPRLEGVCDLKALEMDVASPEFEEGAFLFDPQECCDVSAVYICFDDDARSLATALKIHRRLGAHKPPIVIRLNQLSGLARLLNFGGDCSKPGYATGEMVGSPRECFVNLHPFGLLDRTCKPELLFAGDVEKLARIIHEIYVLQQKELGFSLRTNKSIEDWDLLPDFLKNSNRRQARTIDRKLKDVGCGIVPLTEWTTEPVEFTQEEIEIMAEMEHDIWYEERIRSDWTHVPGHKDIEKKTHPFLFPWQELSEEVKEYDRNMVRSMPTYLARAGYRIFRLKGILPALLH